MNQKGFDANIHAPLMAEMPRCCKHAVAAVWIATASPGGPEELRAGPRPVTRQRARAGCNQAATLIADRNFCATSLPMLTEVAPGASLATALTSAS